MGGKNGVFATNHKHVISATGNHTKAGMHAWQVLEK